jgi:hypothetical protein
MMHESLERQLDEVQKVSSLFHNDTFPASIEGTLGHDGNNE